MAGIAAPNLPVYYRDTADRRTGEVPLASWTNGCNDAGSNAPGLGIATGEYGSSVDTGFTPGWPDPGAYPTSPAFVTSVASQQIGRTATQLECIQGADVNDQLNLVKTAGAIAPGAALVASGPINRTGLTVPTGTWCFGTLTVA